MVVVCLDRNDSLPAMIVPLRAGFVANGFVRNGYAANDFVVVRDCWPIQTGPTRDLDSAI